jgi:hypothetical protein
VVTPLEDRVATVLHIDAEATAIPLTEALGVARFEEHAADAANASRRGHQPMA